ncbi:thioesterase family protein [Texcoconibacillus texcoconensis]
MNVQNEAILTKRVHSGWVDYNGHMNDAAYAQVFSHAVDALMDTVGLDEAGRSHFQYTIFTLETHLCYLKEVHLDDSVQVDLRILDYDAKRLHVFFEMKDSHGDLVATSEQMLLGMDTNEQRPSSFPEQVESKVKIFFEQRNDEEKPKQVGRTIGIRR